MMGYVTRDRRGGRDRYCIFHIKGGPLEFGKLPLAGRGADRLDLL